ncbi:ROK family protein [Glaciecola sp. 1036]|uniref:ROK family protein n=1 Tax=Alteromonadaceae TaxID=72275 RepID=UPI003CFE7A86
MKYYAAIEAGGTKFVCAVFDEHRNLVAKQRIPTTSPTETLAEVVRFFNAQIKKGFPVCSMGIASFGPLDLNPESPTFGYITNTPKKGWSNIALLPQLQAAFSVPTQIDTDVNAAALAEYKWGAGQQLSPVIYVTVGTGIGAGVVINGQPLHGLVHPEIGHMKINTADVPAACCPFHGSCLEGVASGPAMQHIWQVSAETLPSEHAAWELEAKLLAQLCHNLMLSFSARKIILGGGVMAHEGLISKIIHFTQISLAGYLTLPPQVQLSDIIVATGLGENSGLLGAFALSLSKSAH